MNTKTILISFLSILFLHYLAFSSIIFNPPNLKQNRINSDTKEQINIKLASIKKQEVAPKKVKENSKKKEVVKKKIVKQAQKKPVNKTVIKPKKKVIEKKPKKKKKSSKEVIQKKPTASPVATKLTKTIKKTKAKANTNTKQANTSKEQNRRRDKYLANLREEINKNKYYPRISNRLKEQGVVTLSFRVFKNGKIKNIKIKQSSKKSRLNNAAIKAVEDTSGFKAFPKEIRKEYLDIDLKIGFTLK